MIILPFLAKNRPAMHHLIGRLEAWLEAERTQLPLWLPVAVGTGVVFWENYGDGAIWIVLCLCIMLHLSGYLLARESRAAMILKIGALCVATGFMAIFLRSAGVASPPIEKIQISEFYGRIVKVEHLSARDIVRFELETGGHADLPNKIRVNLAPEKYRPDFSPGAIIRVRARLMPPAGPNVPGGYDFARRAWFSGIGATGTVLGEISLHKASPNATYFGSIRRDLSRHILAQLPPASGSIAAALATGDRGAISDEDAQAMRDSGMAHLLSISGLHVTAVVGAIFLIMSRLLALIPFIALRFKIPLFAASIAALGAIGYTLLTGAEVPTVRSCIAALLILAALALGRDALTLRLVGFGALVILLFWPETLAGPSFQLSFAAVITIIVLHESAWMRHFAQRREEGILRRMARGVVILLVTGFAIEMILAPIAIFHFHKTGLYGALANVIAIPLTTFIVMPFEALGLLFDAIGMGAPFWWIAGKGLELILALAHGVSNMPGAVSMLPVMPNWAFAALMFSALWFGIFRTKARYFAIPVFFAGLIAMVTAPYPDILVTGDGKHLAVIDDNGQLALLRERAGDYVRDTLRENAGVKAEPISIESWPGAACSPDACIITLDRGERRWNVMAIRSSYMIPSMELAAACRRVDIVVSDRWLPWSCKPKWIKADRGALAQSGGLAFYLDQSYMASVAQQNAHHPWSAYRRLPDKKSLRQGTGPKPNINDNAGATQPIYPE